MRHEREEEGDTTNHRGQQRAKKGHREINCNNRTRSLQRTTQYQQTAGGDGGSIIISRERPLLVVLLKKHWLLPLLLFAMLVAT